MRLDYPVAAPPRLGPNRMGLPRWPMNSSREPNRPSSATLAGHLVRTIAAFLWLLVVPSVTGSDVIAVIGDFGAAAESPAKASNEMAVANLVRLWNPDFVITTGDNNYPAGAASTIDVNIGQFYQAYISPYTGSFGGGAVSNRFFPCLGNHDWMTATGQPYLDYFTLPGNERYYSYRAEEVEIFAVNSNADADGTSSTSVQGRWLQARLAASTARWKLVYFHHPPYSSDAGGAGNPAMRWPFAAWGATAVFTGHDHLYARMHTNSLVYFINGLGGDEIHGGGSPDGATAVRYTGDYGAMRLEATDTNLVFHFVTRNQVIVDTYVLGAPIGSPFLLAHPQGQTVPAGRTVTFGVHATGAFPLRYQWQLNAANLAGATNRSLVISNVQTFHEGDYSVVVSSGASSNQSDIARLSLLRHPVITQHPVSQTTLGGATVTFRVVADGAGLLRYQWFLNGLSLLNATATSLTLTNVHLKDIGEYTVRVTDDLGLIWSNPANLDVRVRPVVTHEAVSQSVAVGQTAVFSVSAMGTLPLSYSWRRDGRVVTNVILNQNTCFWTIANVQLTNAGGYRVGVTNSAGPANGLSSNAVLTVLQDFDVDGIPDAWELANGFLLDDPADAGLDADGDGNSNREEYVAGTDPHKAEDHLRIDQLLMMPAGSALEFTASSNRTYAVEYRDDVPGGSWNILAEITAASTNRVIEVIDPVMQVSGQGRFYRLVTPRLLK
jgi:tartrate-resistant acid phosphatase type 5